MNMIEHPACADQSGILILHDAAHYPKQIVLPVESYPRFPSGSAPNEMNEEA